jgi:predicted MFS family arabinose efflux permease
MVGSIIATFTSWRAIFGVQGGMTFLGMALAFLFVPRNSELSHLREQEKSKTLTREDILHAFNPVNVFRLWKFPSILLAVRLHRFLTAISAPFR